MTRAAHRPLRPRQQVHRRDREGLAIRLRPMWAILAPEW